MKTPKEQEEILSTMIDRLTLLRKAIVLESVNPGGKVLDSVMESCANTFAVCYVLKYGEEPRI